MTLQAEMDEQIQARLAATRDKLFEHFDEDVHERLRLRLADARAQLDRFGRRFWAVTRLMLADRADFDDEIAVVRAFCRRQAAGAQLAAITSSRSPAPETPRRGAVPPVAPARGVRDRVRQAALHRAGRLIFDVTRHPTARARRRGAAGDVRPT